MSPTHRIAVLTSALTIIGACLPELEISAPAVQALGSQCPMWGCGLNTGDVEFTEFHLGGAANSDGLTIAGVKLADGTEAELDVVGGELLALDANDNVIAAGEQLEGANIHLRDQDQTHLYDIKVVTP